MVNVNASAKAESTKSEYNRLDTEVSKRSLLERPNLFPRVFSWGERSRIGCESPDRADGRDCLPDEDVGADNAGGCAVHRERLRGGPVGADKPTST